MLVYILDYTDLRVCEWRKTQKIREKTAFMLKILPVWNAHTHECTAVVPELKRSDKVNVKCLIMQHPVKALSGTEGSI